MIVITNVTIMSQLLLSYVIVVIMSCCASHGHVDLETCQTNF